MLRERSGHAALDPADRRRQERRFRRRDDATNVAKASIVGTAAELIQPDVRAGDAEQPS